MHTVFFAKFVALAITINVEYFSFHYYCYNSYYHHLIIIVVVFIILVIIIFRLLYKSSVCTKLFQKYMFVYLVHCLLSNANKRITYLLYHVCTII